jgi:hypothetical protein
MSIRWAARMVAIAAVAAALAADARPAAACSKHHQSVFELFELARDVAVVRVGRVPRAHRAGPVGLRVTRRLKGGRARALTARETNTSCAAGFRAGRTALVFLAADRWPAGAYEGYQEQPPAAVVDALAAWAAAATPAARAAVLVGAATGADRGLARDAAFYLADRPELIALLDDAQTAALGAARGDRRTDEWIALVLARQHGAAWKAMVAAGGLPRGPLAALAAHDHEAITDVGVLADLIAGTPGEAAPARIAAFERCERVHGKAITGITRYGRGHAEHYWPRLADACRTGTPPPW